MTAPTTDHELARSRGSLWWQLPTALWAYAMLRALAFAAPAWTEGGRVGLGAIVVAVLFVKIARGSRASWTVLAWLDVVMLVMLLTAWFASGDAPLAIPILATAATITLFAPSIRQHVRSGAT